MEQLPTNLWNDSYYDLIKTDFLLAKSKTLITMSPISTSNLTAGVIKSLGVPIQSQVPVAIGAGFTTVTISASQMDRPVIITAAATVPADFAVVLPNVSDVTAYLTTADTNISFNYGDSFKVSVVNLNTNAGHAIFADTTSSDTFVPPQASNAGMILPQTITEFTYIVDPTATPLSGFVIADLGVSKNYADSQLALHVNNHTDAHFGQDLTSTGSAVFQTLSVAGALSVTGINTLSNTTTSTSPTTGALVVAGGIGASAQCSFATNVDVGGGITFSLSTGGSLLQYYSTQLLSGAWTGAWTGAGLSQPIKIVRIGDLVTLASTAVDGVVGANDSATYNAVIPANLRPSTAPQWVTYYGKRFAELRMRTNPANIDYVTGTISLFAQDYSVYTSAATDVGNVYQVNFTSGDTWVIDSFTWSFVV